MKPFWWAGCAGAAVGVMTVSSALARAEDAPAPEPPPTDAATEPAPKQKGWGELIRFTAIWENDGAGIKPASSRDDHYTNGLMLDFTWKPQWAQDWLAWMPLTDQFGDAPETAFGLSVRQVMFTPVDLESRAIIEDDRPYAGWLALSAYWQRTGQINDTLAMYDHIEIDGGVVGQWSGAEAVQKFVHAAKPDEIDPQGWPNQISNTPAFDLTLRRKWRFSTDANADGVSLQFIPSVGGTVGTVYRRLEADALVRVGWNMPDDFGPTRIADVNAATGGWSSRFGFYLFGRAGGRAVQHNIFLDGPDFKSSPHTVDSEPLYAEFQIGAVVLLWSNFEIGYSQTFLTDQFKGQKDSDSFGALTLGYRVTF